MKLVTSTAIAALLLGAPAAFAADVYHQGGMKDEGPVERDYGRRGWSGFVITGMLGYASRDIKGSRTINGEGGFFCDEEVPNNGPDGIAGNADDSFDIVRTETPVVLSNFAGSGGDFSSEGLQGGVEFGYRRQMGGWVGELALGVNLDADSKKSASFATEHALTWEIPLDDQETITGSGFQSIEKQGDGTFVARLGHLFGSDQRMLIGVGGGLAVGRFNVKGGHDFDGDVEGLLSTRFDDTELAFGYVLEAYARYKIDNNWDAGILGQYKDFGTIKSGANTDFDTGGSGGLYAHVRDEAKFDVDEWTVKGTLTYTFDY
jgi:hypothetical protein